MLHLPAIIERLTESNTAGGCYLQLVPVEHIQTMPDEVRGTVPTEIVLREGYNWITVYPTRWTQEFSDDWVVVEGARYSRAGLGGVLPKDRASLLYGLWQLHHGRFVVLHYDMNRTVKVLGTVAEPAQVRIQRIQHGDKPGQDRNQYLLQVAVTRRTQCPFYLATPPEIVDPTECPNMTQLMVDSNAAFIAAALEDAGMLEGVQAIICTSCPSLCELLDTALAGGGPDPEQPITVTLDGTPYTLTYQGLDGGKPWYQDAVTMPNISTYWDGSQWVTELGDGNIFTSASDTPTPGAATGWTGGTGTLTVEDWSGSGAGTVTDCLSPEQVVVLLEALIALESWATIESLLSPAQLEAAIASLGGSGASLCDAIEEALAGSGPAGITLTSGANEDFLPQTGTFSGKPVYFLVNYAATGFSAEATWTGTEWYLTDGVNEWTSAEDVATPGDVVTWTGDTPLPTVVTSGPVSPSILLDCLTTEQEDTLFGEMVDDRTWADIEAKLDGTQLAAAEASICDVAPDNVLHEYISSGTWTKPASPLFKGIWLYVAGGGASGGAGGSHSAGCTGGSGGGGGAGTPRWIPAASLLATEDYVVGAGGASVASGNGLDGGDSSFGAHVVSVGGTKGVGGTTATTLSGGAGGSSFLCTPGAGEGSVSGAGGGSAGRTAAQSTAGTVGRSNLAGPGGGGASGINGGAAAAGKDGGGCYTGNTLTTGGAGGAINTDGVDGVDDVNLHSLLGIVVATKGFGTAGGGGGGNITAGLSGGNGGDGGRGAGGGGGGGTINTGSIGQGGAGGNGFILLYEVYSNN